MRDEADVPINQIKKYWDLLETGDNLIDFK